LSKTVGVLSNTLDEVNLQNIKNNLEIRIRYLLDRMKMVRIFHATVHLIQHVTNLNMKVITLCSEITSIFFLSLNSVNTHLFCYAPHIVYLELINEVKILNPL